MGFRHNNQLPNGHFHKDWQRRVKTWFNQPARKQRRRIARMKKAEAVAPRPVDGLLRPAVRCPTVRYNIKVRSGRGFTLEELKEAGVGRKEARTIGISVDYRRRNRSAESLQLNVQRLKTYLSKLVVFPKSNKKQTKRDSPASELEHATQLKKHTLMPVVQPEQPLEVRAITQEEKDAQVYKTLRTALRTAQLVGVREKRHKEKLAEAEASAKK